MCFAAFPEEETVSLRNERKTALNPKRSDLIFCKRSGNLENFLLQGLLPGSRLRLQEMFSDIRYNRTRTRYQIKLGPEKDVI